MPTDWPPGDYDQEAMQYFLEKLTAGGRDAAGWYNWYALLNAEGERPRTLIGSGGFTGPPDATGTAEIGYSIAADWQGRGLATELVAGLLQQATATGMVRKLVAHTAPENMASQKVLLANGFESSGTDVNGQLRFERTL